MSDRSAHRSEDPQAAAWVFEALVDRSGRLDMLLPPGFAAYARLVHRDGPGQMPEEDLGALVRVAREHTTTPGRCWFCVWDGYGDPEPVPRSDAEAVFRSVPTAPPAPGARPVPTAPSALGARARHLLTRRRQPRHGDPAPEGLVHGPLSRSYVLYLGPIEAVLAFAAPVDRWWPDDRAWCIGTDTDLDSTYAGGSRELVDQLLGGRALPARPAQLGDIIVPDLDGA